MNKINPKYRKPLAPNNFTERSENIIQKVKEDKRISNKERERVLSLIPEWQYLVNDLLVYTRIWLLCEDNNSEMWNWCRVNLNRLREEFFEKMKFEFEYYEKIEKICFVPDETLKIEWDYIIYQDEVICSKDDLLKNNSEFLEEVLRNEVVEIDKQWLNFLENFIYDYFYNN